MKKYLHNIISLLVLTALFILVRYALFHLHGMKDWPVMLFVLGLISIFASFAVKIKRLPVFTCAGYAAGFIAGAVLQHDYGIGLNSLWIIWTAVYCAFILFGIIFEIAHTKNKKNQTDTPK